MIDDFVYKYHDKNMTFYKAFVQRFLEFNNATSKVVFTGNLHNEMLTIRIVKTTKISDFCLDKRIFQRSVPLLFQALNDVKQSQMINFS